MDLPLTQIEGSTPCDLDSVIITAELDRRSKREVDGKDEDRALVRLTRQLAASPREFFSTLVRTILELSSAESAGVSLLNEQEKRFVWPAVAGGLSHYVGAGTPSDFG